MEHLFSDGSLSFVGQDVECIPPWLSKKYGTNTKRIDLSYNRLRSVKGLVGFAELLELVLDNNQLSDDVEFPQVNTLETLTINKNNIKDLETFLSKVKEKLPNLKYLSMLGNEACPNQLSSYENDEEDYQRYRYYTIYCLPKLKFLDSTPVTADERKEAQRVGAYMKVVTSEITESSPTETNKSDKNASNDLYSPLPSTDSREGDHKSSFGKCRYVYYGKHSEGNRFIVNNDL
ncbi:leucine-rich melanocyte differentiation-associated protein-like isoform X2 [Hydractinia symbiolongicarpus]|uniref:leucine-rich melanocyte differentiation-associated protein-like isoform X2 n=1 Tax=Hydractinia symbiolongicarpus TaxID=13093 RepID=UPI00254CED28|nr:leucine-rich melanocyte differentiation-associated protein-like isoform X2 [Hydractinia symbiolongicarpus]